MTIPIEFIIGGLACIISGGGAWIISGRRATRAAEDRHRMDEFNEWTAARSRYLGDFPRDDT